MTGSSKKSILRATGVPSAKQITSFKDADAKINIWEGAVRSGKTYISLWRFLTELSEGPAGEYVLITRTYDSFKRNVLPEMMLMIGADVKYFKGNRELNIYGKTIHIVGADDERAEAKIRGPTFSGAYVDEITIIPESVFRMLISRCAMRGAKIFGTTNPDSPYHWLKRDFLDDNPDVKSWQFTLDDNPQLTEDDREYLKRQYKGLWYQRFIEGKWVQAEGSIYDFFDEKYHVIDFAPNYAASYFVGIDYGTTNPCAFVLIGHDPSRFPNYWVESEYYFDSHVQQRQKTDTEYAEDLKRFIAGKNIKAIYLDPSAVSFRLELQKQGVQNVFEGVNKVLDGIRFVTNLFNNGTVKVCRNCKNVIKEMQSYVWDAKKAERGVEEPKKENDHSLDALRYALYTHLFNKSAEGLTAKELEDMHREAMGGMPNLPEQFQMPQEFRGLY
jgi:PBSX family phage terminase large subunit